MIEKDTVQEAYTDLAPRYEKTVDDELRTFWGWSYEGFVDHLIQHPPWLKTKKSSTLPPEPL